MSMFLTENSLKTLVSSFVFTRIDYCNSLLSNLPNTLISKLQRMQNCAARIVLKKSKKDHVTPLLLHLHWLPVDSRIMYKVAVLCHKCLNSEAPSYLSQLIEQYTPSRSLRSCDKHLLRIPRKGFRKLCERSFCHFAPSVWNSLPESLRQVKSADTFKMISLAGHNVP